MSDHEPEECACCGYATELGSYEDGIPRQTHRLCRVCACTFLSKAVTYPSQCPDPSLYRSVGWVANEILARLAARP